MVGDIIMSVKSIAPEKWVGKIKQRMNEFYGMTTANELMHKHLSIHGMNREKMFFSYQLGFHSFQKSAVKKEPREEN